MNEKKPVSFTFTSAIELTPSMAKKLYKDHNIYAYDERLGVTWCLKTIKELLEAIKNNNVLYIENDYESK